VTPHRSKKGERHTAIIGLKMGHYGIDETVARTENREFSLNGRLTHESQRFAYPMRHGNLDGEWDLWTRIRRQFNDTRVRPTHPAPDAVEPSRERVTEGR
jgi:hypothetical protein